MLRKLSHEHGQILLRLSSPCEKTLKTPILFQESCARCARAGRTERLDELGAEIADLRTHAANHAKELESIEARWLTCPA